MSSGQKVPRASAELAATRLMHELVTGCQRIEIAGSIRRGRDPVGDIELVAIPRIEREQIQPDQRDLFGTVIKSAVYATVNHLDGALQDLLDREMIRREPPAEGLKKAWGEKYKKFWIHLNEQLGWVQVDLFIATPENWGAIFTIRTGPEQFSKALVTWARFRTGYIQDEGYLREKATGRVIATPEEQDYFKQLGAKWIPPSLRDRRDALELCCDPSETAASPSQLSLAGKTVKALSLWQPWATLIAIGAKQYETRSWETPYRGLLAIHAAKRPINSLEITDDIESALIRHGEKIDRLPLGAILCIVRLVAVVPVEEVLELAHTDWRIKNEELAFGNYAPGRFAWKLDLLRVAPDPLPAKGAQGLWDWDGVVDRIEPGTRRGT